MKLILDGEKAVTEVSGMYPFQRPCYGGPIGSLEPLHFSKNSKGPLISFNFLKNYQILFSNFYDLLKYKVLGNHSTKIGNTRFTVRCGYKCFISDGKFILRKNKVLCNSFSIKYKILKENIYMPINTQDRLKC